MVKYSASRHFSRHLHPAVPPASHYFHRPAQFICLHVFRLISLPLFAGFLILGLKMSEKSEGEKCFCRLYFEFWKFTTAIQDTGVEILNNNIFTF